MPRCVLVSVVLMASLGSAEPARAVDYLWQNSTGGAFTEFSNWLPFVPPSVQGPGGALDTVNFDLGTASTSPYLITDVTGQNDQLIVHNDSLQLSVFPDYTLLNAGSANPSFVVGAGSSDTATLILSGSNTSMFETDVARIGNVAGSTGNVIVAELEWTSGNLRVGHAGSGTLTIEEGAVVTSTNASIGHLSGAAGEAIVGDDASWTTSGDLLIGREGQGSMTVGFDAVVTNANASIGAEQTGDGSVHISGQFTTWTINNMLTVGGVGDGEVVMTGGSLTTLNAAVGDLPASDGFVLISGDSEWTTTGRLKIGGDMVGPTVGGSGLVRISGGDMTVGEAIDISPNGILELQSGMLTPAAVTLEGTGQFDWTGGIFFVDEFNGDLVNQGGSLVPSDDEDSVINGDYTQQAGGRISFSILGEAANNLYSSLDVTGTVFLGGELVLSGATLYEPNSAEVYTILQAGEIVGSFNNVASGGRVENSRGSFVTYYGPGSPFDPDHVVLANFQLALPGDFNADGVVDAADYVVWRDKAGQLVSLLNDGNLIGPVGQPHYDLWRANFGRSTGGGSLSNTTVPEPLSLVLLILSLAGMSIDRRRTLA